MRLVRDVKEGARGGTMGSPTASAGVGFEPTEPCGSTVFKTAPFDRSGTPPGRVSLRGARAGLGARCGPSAGASRMRAAGASPWRAPSGGRDVTSRPAKRSASLALEDDRTECVARGGAPRGSRPARRARPSKCGRQLDGFAHRGQLRPCPGDRDHRPPPPRPTLARTRDSATRRGDETPRTEGWLIPRPRERSEQQGLDRAAATVGAGEGAAALRQRSGTVRLRSAPCTARSSLARAVAVARSTGTRRPDSFSARSRRARAR